MCFSAVLHKEFWDLRIRQKASEFGQSQPASIEAFTAEVLLTLHPKYVVHKILFLLNSK